MSFYKFNFMSGDSRLQRVARALTAMSLGIIVVALVAEVLLWGAAAWHDREEPTRTPRSSLAPQATGPSQILESPSALGQLESRVIFVGNSHTRGAGLPISKSFPVQLDARWRARESAWRALNLGRTNYNSTQIREALPTWLDETGAKLVVAMVGEPNLWNRVGKEAALGENRGVGRSGILGTLQSRSRLFNFLSLLWLRHRDSDARAWRALGIVEPNYRGPGNFAPQEWGSLYLDDLRRAQRLHPQLPETQLCRWKSKLEFLRLELEADLQGTHAKTLAQLESELEQVFLQQQQQLTRLQAPGKACVTQAAPHSQADAVAWLLTAERLWARAHRAANHSARGSEQEKQDAGGDPAGRETSTENSTGTSRSKAWQSLRESIEAASEWSAVYHWMLKLGSLERLTRQQRISLYQQVLSVDPTHSLAAQLVLQELIEDGRWTDFLKLLIEFQKANPLSAQFAPGHFRNLLSQKAPQDVLVEFDRAQAQLVSWRPEASALYVDFSEAEWREWIEHDLHAILKITESKGAQLVLQGYPPYRSPSGDRVCRILDPWLKQFAENQRLPWIDTCQELQKAFAMKQKPPRSRESFYLTQYGPHDDHLNELGYARLAEILDRELQPILERIDASKR